MTSGPRTPNRASFSEMVSALPVGLVMPWRVCAGPWRDGRLFASLLFHLFGAVFFLMGLVVLDEVLWRGNLKYDIASGLSDEPLLTLLVLVVWVLAIELTYALVAWVTACWGALAEPYMQTLGRSLSRWYQLTPCHAALTLVFFVALDFADRFESFVWDHGYHASLSWEIERLITGLIYISVVLAYIALTGWVTLRTLAVPRSAAPRYPHCRWPAVCEGCGYALLGLARDQSCPECGLPIHDSLHTPRGSLRGGLLSKMRLALFHPSHFGRHLLTRTPLPGPGRALALSALGLLMTGPVGVLFISVLLMLFVEYNEFDGVLEFAHIVLVIGFSFGMTAMVGGVTLMLTAGSLAGLIERLFGKRQSLPAAMQAACYTGGWVVGWSLAMFGVTGLMVIVGERMANHGNYTFLSLMPLAWLAVAAAFGIAYLVHVSRIVRAARHANV